MTLSPARIQTQDVQFSVLVSARTWRWTTRMDVSGPSPTFQIVDIVTPFGFLRDSIPLPGDVVQSMATSIQTMMTNFKPTMLLGPPSSLVFSVDEGRGMSPSQAGLLTNIGVFGSLLDGSLASSADYVEVLPAVIGGLASNQYGSFNVIVDSTDLLAVSSPYSASITVQDLTATTPSLTFPITINVRPKAVISTNVAMVVFNVDYPLGGEYPPIDSLPFLVTNTGLTNSVLEYQIVRLVGLSQNWLTGFLPSSGSLNAGGSATINVSIAPITGLYPGTYEETLRISGYSSNAYTDVLIRLVIT